MRADCALVTPTFRGSLDGAEIDSYRLVARLGIDWRLGAPEPTPGAGTRSVRFVELAKAWPREPAWSQNPGFFAAWRNMTHARLAEVIRGDHTRTGVRPMVVYVGARDEQQRLAPAVEAFMRQFGEVSDSSHGYSFYDEQRTACRLVGCDIGSRFASASPPSLGFLALHVLFDQLACRSVQMFGFEYVDAPRRGRAHSVGPDLEVERWFLHHILGGGSWRVRANVYRSQCIHPLPAPACMGSAATRRGTQPLDQFRPMTILTFATAQYLHWLAHILAVPP